MTITDGTRRTLNDFSYGDLTDPVTEAEHTLDAMLADRPEDGHTDTVTDTHPHRYGTRVTINPDAVAFGVPTLAADELAGTVTDTGVERGGRWYQVATDAGTDLSVPAGAVSRDVRPSRPGPGHVPAGAQSVHDLVRFTAEFSVEELDGPAHDVRAPARWVLITEGRSQVLHQQSVSGLDQLVDCLAALYRGGSDGKHTIRIGAAARTPAGEAIHAYEEVQPSLERTPRGPEISRPAH